MVDQNSLELSDEDFLKEPEPSAPVPATPEATTEVETDDEQEDTGTESDSTDSASTDADEPTPLASDDDAPDEDELSKADEPTTGPQAGKPAESKEKKPGTEAQDPKVDGKQEPKPTAPVSDETPAIDYKAEYEKLLAPFKANNKEFTIKSVDDAKALMQMGANYSKKMQALKPHLKMVKSLENAGLLNDESISFMIDLMANKPGAVNKLVKDKSIDPMELDADKAGEYQAGNHTVSDTEMDLDEVMNDLQDSPKIGDLISLVTKEMDHVSKKEISDSPAILRTLDNHMRSGIYDVITAELNRERILGRLNNVPFLKAYEQVGDALQKVGGFNHLFENKSPEPKASTPPKVVEPPKPTQAEQDKLNAKRRAASSNRPVVAAPSTNKAKDFDPLAMTDADFLKMGL